MTEKFIKCFKREEDPPVVEILPDVSRGKAPLVVHFDGDLYDEDGEVLSLEWDFEGDGVFEFSKNVKNIERPQRLQALRLGLQREHIYRNPGIYHAVARVTDDKGESTVSSVTIQVHSDRPYLDITPCDTEFDYMAQAGYEAFFKSGITDSESIRFQMGNYWISYQWENQLFGEVNRVKGVPESNKIWFRNVFSNCDIRYTVQNDLLLEELIVRQFMPLTVIEQSFQIHGIKYKMEEDGSIGFYNGEDLVFSIPRPVMYEFGTQDCQYVCETITHTEWWIKRSVSFDHHHWSTPENVVQVKSTTGNPAVIEKQNGTFIMYYKDKYVWTEEHCELDTKMDTEGNPVITFTPKEILPV